jgi:hypothetical protein
MWRRFSGRRGYGPVGGYRRRSVGFSYGGTVLIVAFAALLFLYLMGYL